MSADRQRLKNAIRAIALTPEERRQLLGEGQNKGGKASSAGVGTSEAEESRLCCDGSTSGNANPGTSVRDPDASSQGGLDSSDPAKLSNGDGTLSGVTDCATGEPVCFDGSGFVPPDRWDDPKSPGPVESYGGSDKFWAEFEFGAPLNIDWTAEQACMKALDNSYKRISCDDDFTDCQCINTSENFVARVLIKNCSDYPDVALCDEEPDPLLADSWPSDGCTNLAIINGQIVGSKYDPENDGSYSAPRDSIDLCDSQGNQISLAPSANGGWKTINSTNDSGYLYDSSGTQIAHIDGNEYSDPSI